MKKCFVCDFELEHRGRICKSCFDFFEWKYGKNAEKEIEKLRKAGEFIEKWRSQSDKEVEE